MDDERGYSAAAGRFLIFVRPATIVSKRASAEEFRVVRRGFIRKVHGDLALQIHGLVVVPMKLGRRDSMADENRFGIEIVVLLLGKRSSDVVSHPGQRDWIAAAGDG